MKDDLGVTLHTASDQVTDALTQERVLALLAASVGVLALLLASLGLYGVAAYATTRRQTEFGIRIP